MRTRRKIAIARGLAACVRTACTPFGGPPREVRRGGIRWAIDWSDGIDLSIALLGAFERRVQRACRHHLPRGGVAIDVGANVGAIALPLARRVGPRGRVHAFEPTVRGVERIRRNLALNPDLASRVEVHHAFVAIEGAAIPESLPARWPVAADPSSAVAGHGGVACPTEGAATVVLDELLERGEFPRIDLIKLDVDGHEAAVLEGAESLLRRHRPPIVLELAPDAHDEVDPTGFGRMLDLLAGAGYRLRDFRGRPVPRDEAALRATIPRDSGRNVVAEHPEACRPPGEAVTRDRGSAAGR